MKTMISILLTITLSSCSYIVDIPKLASEHVVNFNIAGSIYGTGSHINFRGKTYIITNSHICKAGIKYEENSKYITVNDKKAKILKIWDDHDLCALESWKSYGLSIALTDLELLDKIHLIGYPRGLPLTIRDGRYIADKNICFSALDCYAAQLITTITYGGNSGSPVINEYGSVVGILFAGNSAQFGMEIYHTEGYMVSKKDLVQFLKYLSNNENLPIDSYDKYLPIKEDLPTATLEELIKRISDILNTVKN